MHSNILSFITFHVTHKYIKNCLIIIEKLISSLISHFLLLHGEQYLFILPHTRKNLYFDFMYQTEMMPSFFILLYRQVHLICFKKEFYRNMEIWQKKTIIPLEMPIKKIWNYKRMHSNTHMLSWFLKKFTIE